MKRERERRADGRSNLKGHPAVGVSALLWPSATAAADAAATRTRGRCSWVNQCMVMTPMAPSSHMRLMMRQQTPLPPRPHFESPRPLTRAASRSPTSQPASRLPPPAAPTHPPTPFHPSVRMLTQTLRADSWLQTEAEQWSGVQRHMAEATVSDSIEAHRAD